MVRVHVPRHGGREAGDRIRLSLLVGLAISRALHGSTKLQLMCLGPKSAYFHYENNDLTMMNTILYSRSYNSKYLTQTIQTPDVPSLDAGPSMKYGSVA